VLKAFNLLEIFWDYDIIVTTDMPFLGYYPALGLYSAGKSKFLTLYSKYFLKEQNLRWDESPYLSNVHHPTLRYQR